MISASVYRCLMQLFSISFAVKGYSYVAPSVLFTDNAITRDIENNNASMETAKNAQDFCLHVAAQFKVHRKDIVHIC